MNKDEALDLALEELENCADLLKVFEAPIDSCVGATMLQAEATITAIKQALAADVREPVATLFGSLPVYETPPAAQRQWVGLTDEERAEIAGFAAISDWHDFEVIDAVEAKLKEKNNG